MVFFIGFMFYFWAQKILGILNFWFMPIGSEQLASESILIFQLLEYIFPHIIRISSKIVGIYSMSLGCFIISG